MISWCIETLDNQFVIPVTCNIKDLDTVSQLFFSPSWQLHADLKCAPQILGYLSIHIFKLSFFLIAHSCRVFADQVAHFAECKFFDVGEKYFFCFQPVLGIKLPRQIYCAAWSIVTQHKIKIHGSERQQIADDEIFFKQKNRFTNV